MGLHVYYPTAHLLMTLRGKRTLRTCRLASPTLRVFLFQQQHRCCRGGCQCHAGTPIAGAIAVALPRGCLSLLLLHAALVCLWQVPRGCNRMASQLPCATRMSSYGIPTAIVDLLAYWCSYHCCRRGALQVFGTTIASPGPSVVNGLVVIAPIGYSNECSQSATRTRATYPFSSSGPIVAGNGIRISRWRVGARTRRPPR